MNRFLFAACLFAAPAAFAQTDAPTPAASAQSGQQNALNLRPIEPANALERTFVAALDNAAMRPVFRRQLLESHVAIALASNAPDAPPLEMSLREGVSSAVIFTSAERLDQVLGPSSPRAVMTGRAALERLRGKNVIINLRLMPMLTLEAEDVDRYLATPASPGSAGPSQ